MLLNIKKASRFFKFYNGPFFSWNKAKLNSLGYDNKKLLDYIYQTAKKAKKLRIFEKDGFVKKKFDINKNLKEIIKNLNKKKINVIDFGGGFATLYFQFREYFQKFNWHIVEQEKVCVLAKNFLAHERNLFYYSDLVKIKTDVDIIIFSSSIQYIQEFSDIIIKAKALRPKYIIFLKTPINKTPFNLIFVQKIPGKIYEGSYPSWAFSSDCINDILRLDYNLIIKEKVEPKLFFVNHYDFFYELVV